MCHGVEDVCVRDVQRRESETGHVRGAEVADHAPLDECLHDAVSVVVAQGDLAAAYGVRTGSDHLERRPEPLVDQGDEQIGQREGRAAQVVEQTPSKTSRAASRAESASTGGVPEAIRATPRRGT